MPRTRPLAGPELLAALLHDDGAAPWPVPALVADNAAQWPELLRRYRAAESTRLVWRDVHGLDTVDDTLAGTTANLAAPLVLCTTTSRAVQVVLDDPALAVATPLLG